MKYTVIEDAPVLTPNPSHLNFTESSEVIPSGTIVEGKEQYITGKRRGQPFKYRLFITKDNQLIHLNKVKPMESTEIKLDATGKPTTVSIIDKKNFSAHTVIGGLLGAYIGYAYSKKKGYSNQKTAVVAVGAGIAGFLVGRQLQKSGVFIKKA
jgi:hypothetical protein